ncbi:Uncharacterised protein [Brevibacterium casei]|uniref:Uncharacterized protein n=1 Tax=Brevibacterium casei TaxID=33889 RepID=A0A449D7E6_9MICO|nr:hypothetical protein [Brevibacterium casei]VEW13555.1 Uncharacterised protein [Brevibacterium casei]
MARPKTTRLSNDTTKPQPTAPGDAPADTWDPKERASSATPDKKAAAEAGHQSVNAVTKVGTVPDKTPTGDRTETYAAVDGAGNPVTVTHNYDTGVTSVESTQA